MTEAITNTADLKARILALEARKAAQEQELKQEIGQVIDTIKPANLVMRAAKDLISSPEFKSGIMSGTLSMLSGLVLKRFMPAAAVPPVKAALGKLVQTAIDKGWINESLKKRAMALLHKFSRNTPETTSP